MQQQTNGTQVGNIKVSIIREVLQEIDPAGLYPNHYTPEAMAAHRNWLEPHFLNESGHVPLSIHAFVLESDGQTIMVDTCLGNRPIAGIDMLSNLGDGFLNTLGASGYTPDSFDTVICTHLHFDHVGWNTVLRDGQWVPTFSKARYLFAKQEYQHWKKEYDSPPAGDSVLSSDTSVSAMASSYASTFGDAVVPVLDSGQADLVETSHRITSEIRLEPTPGHTPGHVSVVLESAGSKAVITGDMVHHPVQFAEPDWVMSADGDPVLATETRRAFAQRYGDTDTLILGTHFAGPACGHLRKKADSWEFHATTN